MVMPRLDGMKLKDARYLSKIEALIQEGIGGFILFGGTVDHTPRHLREIQSLAKIPLLIGADIERGLGQQIAGATRFPNQRAVASAINRRSRKDVALLDRMLDAIRIETRSVGIHAVFSPVVDVNNNPANPIICTRAFGDEPDVVAWFGSRYISRLQKLSIKGRVDVLACAKHYPGHGDTDRDSHTVLPEIRVAKQRLNRVELPPFRQAVKDGVSMVMVAHLLVPALDPDKPTTFSKKTITALLREGMEFGGLIVSDALDMGALSGLYSKEEIAIRAVEAGMDILLHPKDPLVSIDSIVSAVEKGRLTRQRIRESVDRITAAKTRAGLFDPPAKRVFHVDYQKHRRIAEKIGHKTIRILYGNKKLFPLNREGGMACFIFDDDDDADSGDAFIRMMRERFRYLSIMALGPGSNTPESMVIDSITAAESVVIAIFSKISASKGSSGLSNKLSEKALDILSRAKVSGANTVVVSFDSPYLLVAFKDADVRIAAYDRMDGMQQAAAKLLAGS